MLRGLEKPIPLKLDATSHVEDGQTEATDVAACHYIYTIGSSLVLDICQSIPNTENCVERDNYSTRISQLGLAPPDQEHVKAKHSLLQCPKEENQFTGSS